MAGGPVHTIWTLRICRQEPETRWFRRVVLRRKTRLVVQAVLVPKTLELTRKLNGGDTVSFTGGTYDWVDPLEVLMESHDPA